MLLCCAAALCCCAAVPRYRSMFTVHHLSNAVPNVFPCNSGRQKEREIIEALEVELARLQAFDHDAGVWTGAGTGDAAQGPVLPAWRAALNPSTSWWPWADKKPKLAPDDAIAARQKLLYRELAESQKKCAKLEARKIAAIKAKAVYESAGK